MPKAPHWLGAFVWYCGHSKETLTILPKACFWGIMVPTLSVRFAQPTVMKQTLPWSGTISRQMHFGRGLYMMFHNGGQAMTSCIGCSWSYLTCPNTMWNLMSFMSCTLGLACTCWAVYCLFFAISLSRALQLRTWRRVCFLYLLPAFLLFFVKKNVKKGVAKNPSGL